MRTAVLDDRPIVCWNGKENGWFNMRFYALNDPDILALFVDRSSDDDLLTMVAWHGGPSCLSHLASAPRQNRQEWLSQHRHLRVAGDNFRPPVSRPSKILCVGRNYADHAAETGSDVPQEPLIFSKLPNTLVGHGANIQLPGASEQIDFEAELVIVIGDGGRHIPEDKALSHVFGYTCGNDVTARDWQKDKPGGQWLLGKSFDTFAPLGPCVVTADEIPDPQQLDIRLFLNGKLMQSANTCDMLFSVARLISYISNVCSLERGDLIFTGTPSGVGVARSPQVFLKPGDEVSVEIERIGRLTNRVVAP